MTATIRFARLNADSDGPHGGVEHFVASRGLNLLQLDYARPRHIAAPHEAPRELAEYAGGFCDSLRGLGKQLFLEPELRIATSAGWGYAYSCVEAAAKVLVEAGCGEVPISAVRGSNLLPILDYLDSGGVELSHAESGAKWRELKTPVLAADLQLGAGPLATAFAEGARVVVAGCYDAASPLTALAVVEFGWGWEDRDRLAAATLAARSAIWSDSLASGQSVWTNLLASPRPTTCVGIGRDGQFTVETGEPTDAGAAERLAAWLKGTGPNAPGLAHADVHCDASKLACETNGSHQLRISGCGGKKTDGCWRLEALYETGFLAEAIVELAPQTEAAWRRQTAAAIKRHFHDPDRPELDVAVRELWPADTGTGMSWLHLCCRSKRRQDCQRFVDWTIRWVSASAQRARLPVGRPTVSAELGVWPARVPREAVDIAVDTRPAKEWR